jgi:DNA adenine methylase
MATLTPNSAPTIAPRSPLRYPGGKSRAVSAIVRLIPANIERMWSPFLGGGSVELACAARGIRVFGSDLFEPLVNFWNYLLTDATQLADAVEDYLPLPKPRFYHLQKTYLMMSDPLERAAVFFALNRASFSGATLTGGMSPGHPRFTKSSIQRLRDFSVDRFSVRHCDYREAIANAPDEFMYLDPPYIIGSKLYGYKGNMHTNFDHKELARILKDKSQWILSYNDSEQVRQLYEGYEILTPEWVYGMANDKRSREVLIVNLD